MSFDNLAVSISSRTADVTKGIESVKRSLGGLGREATSTRADLETAEGGLEDVRGESHQLTAALLALAHEADEAGDDIGRAGRQAGTTSGMFSALSLSTGGLSGSFGVLTTSITTASLAFGALTVAAGTLSTALVPLLATVGGLATAGGALAGAFGLVVGSGALAYGEQLTGQYQEQLLAVRDQIEELETLREETGSLTDAQRTRLRQLKEEEQRLDDVEGPMSALQARLGTIKDELSGVVAEWGSQFAPLIEDGINALPTLTQNVLSAVGGMDEFGSTLRSLGQAAMRTLPEVAGVLSDLAREALPVFVDFVSFVGDNARGAFEGMMRVTRAVAPQLLAIADAVFDALPEITAFGMRILNVVLPAIESGVGLFESFLSTLNGISDAGDVVDVVTSLAEDGLGGLVGALEDIDVDALLDSLVPTLQQGIRSLQRWFRGSGGDLMRRGFRALLDAAQSIPMADIRGALRSLGETAVDALVDAVSGDASKRFGGSLQGIISNVTGGLVDLQDIHGTAQRLVDGLLGGITSFFKSSETQTAMREINETIWGYFRTGAQDIIGGLTGDQGTVTGGLINSITSYLTSEDARSDLETAFTIALGVLSSAVTGIAAGLTGTDGSLSEITSAVATWASEKGQKALSAAWETLFTGLQTFAQNSLARVMAAVLVTTQQQLNRVYNAFASTFGGIVTLVGDTINAAVSNLTEGVNAMISYLNRAIKAANRLPGVDQQTFGTVEAPTTSLSSYQAPTRTTNRDVLRERVVEKVAEITVEDGEIVAKMDERIDRSDARKGDRANREGV
ncbi:hypothetical protein [Halosimplex pelagicum]|uniref:Uncharacterized protein n=1 Tax=Halosimplex pelagicum TaxID=869886 RepID=A0A7D5P728_9EURY|nr:hypothetical protein [Halosimplex pelagicum]QLH82457.1 hypothetical protein HZS54_12905 [Halosimplex pelagicum]QLH82513.1 hypothetical protein HZS54_13210 [Halosimplex pelagicum]